MKKYLFRALIALFFITICNDDLSAQHRRTSTPRRYHSTTSNILRGLDAADRIADYAMTGVFLHHLDDYTGIRLGLNSATLRARDFNPDPKTDNIVGMNLGVVFGWYLGHTPLVIEPGLFYSMKGGEMDYDVKLGNMTVAKTHLKMKMHNFEIPAVLKASLPLGIHSHIEPFVGPFISFGFAGTTTDSTYSRLDSEKEYAKLESDTFDDYLDDFDAGIRLGAGLAIGHFYLEAAYDMGFVNLCDNSWQDGNSLNSRTWSFNIGFNF